MCNEKNFITFVVKYPVQQLSFFFVRKARYLSEKSVDYQYGSNAHCHAMYICMCGWPFDRVNEAEADNIAWANLSIA